MASEHGVHGGHPEYHDNIDRHRYVHISVGAELFQVAQNFGQKRAKRTPSSPAVGGDHGRPDRDVVGLVCELAYYQWRYGSYTVRLDSLQREHIGLGLNDGGEDDVGINVRGSNLPPGRVLEAQHLLVSVDERNNGKCYPHLRYVAAFYDGAAERVILAGYMLGVDIIKYPPRRVRADGFLSHVVPVPHLRPMHNMPHVGLESAGQWSPTAFEAQGDA